MSAEDRSEQNRWIYWHIVNYGHPVERALPFSSDLQRRERHCHLGCLERTKNQLHLASAHTNRAWSGSTSRNHRWLFWSKSSVPFDRRRRDIEGLEFQWGSLSTHHKPRLLLSCSWSLLDTSEIIRNRFKRHRVHRQQWLQGTNQSRENMAWVPSRRYCLCFDSRSRLNSYGLFRWGFDFLAFRDRPTLLEIQSAKSIPTASSCLQ